jgi:hypothetical protein
MLGGQPSSSGRQARSREVYNLLLSWPPSNRGAGARAARFDRRAASDVAGVWHLPVLRAIRRLASGVVPERAALRAAREPSG